MTLSPRDEPLWKRRTRRVSTFSRTQRRGLKSERGRDRVERRGIATPRRRIYPAMYFSRLSLQLSPRQVFVEIKLPPLLRLLLLLFYLFPSFTVLLPSPTPVCHAFVLFLRAENRCEASSFLFNASSFRLLVYAPLFYSASPLAGMKIRSL